MAWYSSEAVKNLVRAHLAKNAMTVGPDARPHWLISAFPEPRWLIRDGDRTRQEGLHWVDAITVNWSMRLVGGGNLTDPKHHVLLEQMKELLIAELECPDASLNTTKQIPVRVSLYKAVAEWLLANPDYHEAAKQHGFLCVDLQALEGFLTDYRRFGAGPGIWMQQFDQLLLDRFDDANEQERVAAWEALQPPDLLRHIDEAVLSINPNASPQRAKVNTLGDARALQWAKRWLRMKGWYGPDGRVLIPKVADAINVGFARMKSHKQMKFYLRQFEDLKDYSRFEFVGWRERIGHKQQTEHEVYMNSVSQNSLRNVFSILSQMVRCAKYCEGLKESRSFTRIDMASLPASLKGEEGNRTPTMPPEVALFTYDKLIHWGLRYSGPLTDYSIRLAEWVSEHPDGDDPWQRAFECIPVPKELTPLNIVQFAPWEARAMVRNPDGSHPIAAVLRRQMTVDHALFLNLAVSVMLTAAFSARRDDEIRGMTRACMSKGRNGAYIDFSLCKVQAANVRLGQRRPVPRLVHDVLSHQKRLMDALSRLWGIKDRRINQMLFLHMPRLGSLAEPGDSTLRTALDLLCDYLEVPCNDKGGRWYIRLHECRRFFAMAFFWLFPGKSLEALSWFMGHSDPIKTWHYIKESLTGKELAAMAAQRATATVREETSVAAEKLRQFAMRHFGVSDLSMKQDIELEIYLQALYEEGCYTIEPHVIRTNGGGQFELIITICKEPADAEIESR